MTVKLLAAAVGATAALALAGVASAAPAIPGTDPVAVRIPLPLEPPPNPAPVPPNPAPDAPAPAADLPTSEQLTSLLTGLTDPDVRYRQKDDLVAGGIPPHDGHQLDFGLHRMRHDGGLPMSFDVANIRPAGPNTAAADVTVSGPDKPVPITMPVAAVDQGGGWMLTQDSALALMQQIIAH